jgi:hypothetical protein
MHRLNIKGVTHINHFKLEHGVVQSIDSEHIMTHVIGVDFNSLYPSSFSSNYNRNIPYHNGIMYMPGRLEWYQECETEEQKREAIRNIMKKEKLFIAEVIGHIDDDHLNEFINFPPIFRNIDINLDAATLGQYMYDFVKQFSKGKQERKLTMILSTHGEYMSFSSYYLWFLIDRCHFIIDDIRSIMYFSKHTGFHEFVNQFMSKRCEATDAGNKGMETFCKMSMNGSYGYDGKNTEKYSQVSIVNRDGCYQKHRLDNYVSTQRITDDCYIISTKKRNYSCDTCIQESYFTLDNAKYWYLNFVYNFMYKCLDMNRMHFIEGDTDSAYWAVAGSVEDDIHQGFKHVISNQSFYDEYIYDWFPNPNGDTAEKKKLLGLCIEKEAENCIALSPKCYTLFDGTITGCSVEERKSIVRRMKGVSLKKNMQITCQDYLTALLGAAIQGFNVNFQVKNGEMRKVSICKNALTCIHTKMVVLENQSCHCFIYNK